MDKPPGMKSNDEAQHFSSEALRVIYAVTRLSGDIERALLWFQNERLQPFAHKTAEQLVKEGRTDDLLVFIESLEAGPAD